MMGVFAAIAFHIKWGLGVKLRIGFGVGIVSACL